MVKDKREIITVYPTKKHPIRGWLAEDEVKLGNGFFGNVFKVCKDKNCDFIMKVIHKSPHKDIKNEIKIQKICSKYKLCKPITDWWLLQGEGGIIIMPVLKETLQQRLINIKIKIFNLFSVPLKPPKSGDADFDHEDKARKQANDLYRKKQFELTKQGWELILKLHQHGITHNDAHTSNLMFDEKDNLYFIDMAFSYIMGGDYSNEKVNNEKVNNEKVNNNLSSSSLFNNSKVINAMTLLNDYGRVGSSLINWYKVKKELSLEIESLVTNGKSYKEAEKQVIENLLTKAYEYFVNFKPSKPNDEVCTIL